MKFILITNSVPIAVDAQSAGVDRIMVDLEYLGKAQRQGHIDSVKSRHYLSDISKIRPHLHGSELMVRINPLHEGTGHEIDQVIANGADRIMLPMFRDCSEVLQVQRFIRNRVPLTLLFETAASICRIDSIVRSSSPDDVHLGLNDLSLDLGLDFMFELFPAGIVDFCAQAFAKLSVPFGVGGVARIGVGRIPAELVLSELKRLSASRVILSRSFFNAATEDSSQLSSRLSELRNIISNVPSSFLDNQRSFYSMIKNV